MNERIKELVKQMGWEEMGADLYGKSMDGCMTIHALKKFAELLVKECLMIVYERQVLAPTDDDGYFKVALDMVSKDIEQHFGVEE